MKASLFQINKICKNDLCLDFCKNVILNFLLSENNGIVPKV